VTSTAPMKPLFALLAIVAITPLTMADDLGIFAGAGDVGAVRTPGRIAYDAGRQIYLLAGTGANMWFDQDEFFFVWKKVSGDFILSADMAFDGEGVDPHRKLGLMIRESLEPDARYVDVARHGDGLVSLQYRQAPGGDTAEIRSAVTQADTLRLERDGDRYIMSVARRGDTLTPTEVSSIQLPDEVYVGLFVCAHNADVVEQGRFGNVRITVPAPDDFEPYQDYYASRLEIMDVTTGHRRVVHTQPDSMQAPNWTVDGRALIYNRNGLLYRFEIETGEVSRIDTGFATRNNNDHALSFDGRRLAISHHADEHDGNSMIYTLPATGGTPQLVTRRGPSYFHGWSPDGQWLTFTGGRNGAWDIYKVRADGSGDEVRLTDDPALDDGSEFSPDGEYIYFNSARSGKMQIWRMRPDGSGQEQVTDDKFNNWFPHVSPDGEKLVWLAYPPEVEPADHPWYQRVYLMMKPVAGGEARVLAAIYGGQGTINVPSWSPDSRYIAFVSNTVVLE
jgi:TolB protein